jgi:hypothetical protein
VATPLSEMISVLMDVSSYKSWMNMITHSEVLKEVSPFRKLTCIRVDLPKPMSSRQILVQASAHFKEEQVAIALSSFNLGGGGNKWL